MFGKHDKIGGYMGQEMYLMEQNEGTNVMEQAYQLENEKLIVQHDLVAKPNLLITNQNHSQVL